MLVGVALLTRARPVQGYGFRVTLLTTLAFFPVWYCLLQGQDSILLMFLICCRSGGGDDTTMVLQVLR